MPLHDVSDAQIRRLLSAARVIAVRGLSSAPHRDSWRVASYLQQHGDRIIPVNPNVSAVLGERAYEDLRHVPGPVDVVDIFRRPEAVPEIVEAAIAVRARSVWAQEGIVHDAAAETARTAGLVVVMNRCLMREHRRLLGSGERPAP